MFAIRGLLKQKLLLKFEQLFLALFHSRYSKVGGVRTFKSFLRETDSIITPSTMNPSPPTIQAIMTPSARIGQSMRVKIPPRINIFQSKPMTITSAFAVI